MSKSIQSTIRPTQLQPKLYKVVNSLSKSDNYIQVVDKDNNTLCYMISNSLIRKEDLDKRKKALEEELVREMRDYYSNEENYIADFNTLNDCIDDGI